MPSIDPKKLTGEVAARHGLLIREDDPAMALVTMSEMVLEQVLEEAEIGIRAMLAEGEASYQRAQQEIVDRVVEEMERAGNALCARVQRQIDAGQLEAKELVVQLTRVYSRSAVRRWLALGLLLVFVLLLLGVGLGLELGRWLR